MNTAPISQKGHDLLLDKILEYWSKSRGFYYSELLPKLWYLDAAYHNVRQVREKKSAGAAAQCSADFERNLLTLPVAVSDADTATSELAEIFLTGNPIFGVVAPPDAREIIDAWETLIGFYSRRGSWATELYKCFSSGVRYNLPVLEIDWRLSYEFSAMESYSQVSEKAALSPVPTGHISLHSPDPYNMVWDTRVHPSDLSEKGTHAGYNEIVTRIQLKTALAAISMDLTRKKFTLNIARAMETAFPANYYNWKPPVSKFIAADKRDTNWLEWAFNTSRKEMGRDSGKSIRYNDSSELFLLTKIYMKLIPEEYGIRITHAGTPRIYKVWIVNRSYIVYLEPIYTPNNTLPFFLGDLQDDYFDYQSFSEVEKMLPYQDMASELVDTRLRSAQRALGDRAIFDPQYFNEGDINTSEAAAKIPLTKSLRLDQKAIGQVYQQIPFDHASTAGVMGDVQALLQMARLHSGRNETQQGMHRKGNRTLGEFQETQSKGAARQLRLPLRIESMIMSPTKEHIKALISQNVDQRELISTKTRKLISIDPVALRSTLVDFKLTSGLLNKGMYVNSELLIAGFQMMGQNQELAMRYDVAEWFAYMMSMGGVPDVEQMQREMPQTPAPGAPQPGQPQPQMPPGPPESA